MVLLTALRRAVGPAAVGGLDSRRASAIRILVRLVSGRPQRNRVRPPFRLPGGVRRRRSGIVALMAARELNRGSLAIAGNIALSIGEG